MKNTASRKKPGVSEVNNASNARLIIKFSKELVSNLVEAKHSQAARLLLVGVFFSVRFNLED